MQKLVSLGQTNVNGTATMQWVDNRHWRFVEVAVVGVHEQPFAYLRMEISAKPVGYPLLFQQ